MRLSKKKKSNAIQMDLTPMIDIVFLLIIFFITVTQITKRNREQISLPEVESSFDQSETTIAINVRENGEILIGGNSRSVNEVFSILSRKIKQSGDNPLAVSIVLRVDRDCEASVPKRLVEELNLLGIPKVAIGTEHVR